MPNRFNRVRIVGFVVPGLLAGLLGAVLYLYNSPARAVPPLSPPSPAYAWGDNTDGALGDGTTTDRLTPVSVQLPTGVTGFTAIAAGYLHSLGLGSDGKLYSWGYNINGQLGDGTTTDRTTPVLVQLPAGVTSFTAIAAGGLHSMALGNNGKLYA